WELNDDLRAINAIAVPLDGYLFLTAFAAALVALGYIVSRRAPAAFHRAYGRELNRCAALCAVAVSVVMCSVLIEAVLTGLRLTATELSASAVVPALSMAAELALVGALALRIRAAIRRTASASLLLRD